MVLNGSLIWIFHIPYFLLACYKAGVVCLLSIYKKVIVFSLANQLRLWKRVVESEFWYL